MLTILPDSVRSYLSKFLDDNWMIEHGFLEAVEPARRCASGCARSRETPACLRSRGPEGGRGDRVMEHDSILSSRSSAMAMSLRSPTPSVTEELAFLDLVFKDADALHEDVRRDAGRFAAVDADARLTRLSPL